MNSERAAFLPNNGSLLAEQEALASRPFTGDTLFLEGPAGVGKTTVGIARLRHLLMHGVPGSEILVMAPQRTLLTPYVSALRSSDLPPGSAVATLTISGLARRMVRLFWPLVAERAGFVWPDRPPIFLTLETAQYYMARVADPLVESGAFDEVTIDRNRLLGQILDNLNKAALVGLDFSAVGERLRQAWAGSNVRATVYDRAQQCASEFRSLCLTHNLLDFSLQIEVFVKHLLTLPWPPGEGFMTRFTRFRHLIVDNIEEDNPVTHDLLRAWLLTCDSALLIYDQDAGFRVFLGADPTGAHSLRHVCRHRADLHDSFVTTAHLRDLGRELARSLRQTPAPVDDKDGNLRQALVTSNKLLRFHPQMLDWVAEEIAELVHGHAVPPSEIVVVAPYLSDALRFSLSDRLGRSGVPSRSHRPSRALRDEPVARCFLTLAALAHPDWGLNPPPDDVAQALALTIEPLDMVRAHLLTSIVYRQKIAHRQPPDGRARQENNDNQATPVHVAIHSVLNPFTDLNASVQERIGYQAGNQYDVLRAWLYSGGTSGAQRTHTLIDHFFGRLFGEVLSQPGYGFHGDFQAGRIAAQLIDSARKFREVMVNPANGEPLPTGLEYVRMVARGVIAALHVPAWGAEFGEENAVLLAPAYTFLMRNRPVDYQFWLNAGSSGWWERPFQPLTHPYVLTRQWRPSERWTDAHEVEMQTRAMHRLVQGLVRRCRVRIYLGFSELGEQGYEQRGPVLEAIQSALRRRGSGT